MVAPARAQAPISAGRQVLSADFDWKFALGDQAGAEATTFDDARWRVVQVPHDWSIESAPDPKAPAGNGGGYYPAGIGWYRRAFTAPEAWKGKRVTVEFDGIYRNATVYANGKTLGMRPSGYSGVTYDLTPHLQLGARNVLAVRVDNSAQPNSRWYSGSGIYRHVRIVVTDPVHVAQWGVFVTTPEITAAAAKVVVKTTVGNTREPAHVAVETSIVGPGGEPAGRTRSVLAVPQGQTDVVHEVTVPSPALWAPSTPRLYKAVTRLVRGGAVFDEVVTPFGIRTIAWSAEDGLLLNGTPIELAGGSVHHDNGPLGAAAVDRAEERRVEILKAAGFNAVRTAHNIPSPAFIDACDRFGLLVMDEPFDTWRTAKAWHDFSHVFDEWWERDLDAMVLRDRNHPSVVIWGIGNEIPEAWTPEGGPLGQKISDRVRALDPTRPVSQAFPGATYGPNPDATIANLGIVGYNYNIAKNGPPDHARLPARVMMTTESLPRDVFEEWQLSHDMPYIVGEFVWTAMDYLGESGIGGWRWGTPEEAKQSEQFQSMMKQGMAIMGADGKNPLAASEKSEDPSGHPMMRNLFAGRPYHGAECGDVDVTGLRKPQSHYRDILWNRRDRVFAAVRLPAPEGQVYVPTTWSVHPALDSWTWPGREGKSLEVDVYGGTEKVRLLLNDKIVGEQPTGREQRFRATFSVPYAPGTLKALGVNGDKVVAEHLLTTAGAPKKLKLTVDRASIRADGQDLAFVTVEAVDAQGRLVPVADAQVTFAIEGPGTIAAVGSGDLRSDEPYVGATRRLFNGRALAVVRAARTAGSIALSASAPGLAAASVTVSAAPASAVPLLR
jgi:beta-galactosidase